MYRDLQRPPLDVKGLRRSLADGPDAPWTGLDVVAETGSTNDDLLAKLAAAERAETLDRTVLLAEQQVAARGRRDRGFTCEPQSQILMSAILRLPGVSPHLLGWLPLLTGVTVAGVLRETAKIEASLKWPNDVRVDGRKIAGILLQASPPRGRQAVAEPPVVVVGIGLNVSQEHGELPVPGATSLAIEGADCTDRNVLARALLRDLATRVHGWQGRGGAPAGLADEYAAVCDTLGQQVRALLPGGGERSGTAVGIDREGRLIIDAAGERTVIAAGDIEHLRPASGAGDAGR